ncbi:hypothetical protein [Marispirochaeta sp.]|uniref:hypothetical protein n=1 Tax=Marispirochaeta sp. TaxID=2038653 RepID=UPI0029C808D3|nr:hypothetical protein [Marispirochaeta sp.]
MESLRALDYDIPKTSIHGLYHNYFTDAGYEINEEVPDDKLYFTFTLPSPVSDEDLKNGDFSGLAYADLIFIDYDNDYIWENALVYLGAHGGFNHTAVIASDYFDTTLVVDLENDNVVVLDIAYGYSDVRKPAFESFADYYIGPD